MLELIIETTEEAVEYIEAWGHDVFTHEQGYLVRWISGQREIMTAEELIAAAKEIYEEN